MAQTLGTLLIDIKGDTTQLIQGFNRAENAVNKTTKTMGSAVKVLIGAFASLQAVDLAKGYARQVDELQTVNNRLGLVTKSTQEFAKAQEELFKIAQATRVTYAGTIDIYARVARSTQNLNLSQKELLTITDSINKAMIIGGGTAQSQQAALVQLGQAFSANFKAVGQELGSIKEQAPRLNEAMIKGLLETNNQFKSLVEKGQEASGVFRKWAEEGKLSSEIIIKGLQSQGISLNSEFGKINVTIDQSMVTARNSVQKFIYSFDEIAGVSNSVTETITKFSQSIDNLSPEKIEEVAQTIKESAIAIATAYGSLKASSSILSVYGSIAQKVGEHSKALAKFEEARTKAIDLGTQATTARAKADQALNMSTTFGLAVHRKQYEMLDKTANKLTEKAKKQQEFTAQLEQTTRRYNVATIAGNAFRGMLTALPHVAIAVGIGAITTALLNLGRASETVQETLGKTREELSKLTNNQLEHRKELLVKELLQTSAKMREAQERAEKYNATTKTKALADDLKLKFDEQKKKLEEIKKIQDDLKKETESSSTSTTNNISTPAKTPLSDQLQAIIDQRVIIRRQYQELMDELVASGHATAETIKKLKDEEAQKIAEVDKKQTQQQKKSFEEQQKNLQDKENQYYNYYEKVKDYTSLWAIQEKRIREENTFLHENELNKLLQIEKEAHDRRYEVQKEQLSANDWKDYYLKIKEYDNAWLIEQSELFVKYGDVLKEEFPKFAQIVKEEFYDKINEENNKLADDFFKFKLEFDTNGLNDVGKSLFTISDITKEIAEGQELYNKAINEAKQNGQDTAKIQEQHTKNQLIGYSNIAGAISNMFEQGTRQAAIFQTAQLTLATIEATRAVLAQGTGDPYTAIPRMLAMGATVASLLSNIGVAFGLNTTKVTQDLFSQIPENEGKGSVLGDSSAVSTSITKSLDILQDFAEPQFNTLTSMNKYLANISNAIGGVTKLLVRNAGFALGEGFTATDSGYKNNLFTVNDGMATVLTGILTGGAGLIIDKFLLGGGLSNFLGGAVNSVIGGVFGKTKVSQNLQDSGLYFDDALLGQAIEQVQGSLYQTIATTVSKKSWFKKSSSTTLTTHFESMNDELERQFSLVLRNIHNVVLSAGDGLDISSDELKNKLNNFTVSLGKISLKGKTGEQIQQTLDAVFSQVGDNLAEHIFPALVDFQKVGEGLFETMTRVATGVQEAEFYLSKLGNSFTKLNYLLINNKSGNVGFEALLQSITKMEQQLYPTNNNLLKMLENLDSTAEELYKVYVTLEELRDRLIFLKQESQGLSSDMIRGAGSVSELQKGLNSFFENFLSESEQLAYETQQLIQEFNKLNISLPVSKDGFKELLSSLDLTSKSGQELYGRLIILSKSFSDVSEKTAKSIALLESELVKLQDDGINGLSESFKGLFSAITGLKDIATSFINSFSSSNLGNTREQIKQYNKLREQFTSFFDNTGKLNANVTESEAKTIYQQLSTLGQSLGKSQTSLQNELISQFENDLFKLDLSEQVLKVDIVNGLGDILGLTQVQKNQLEKIASDGNITKSELETIAGLTEAQKNGILDFATKSSYFSTENTLSSLAEYAKLQLEMLKEEQANETESLSSKTLSFGDYIGKQEQLDISKTLGVSYDTAKPFIEKVQALSISKNPTADIQSIIGYKPGNTSYDTTSAGYLEKLAQFLPNLNIGGAITGVQTSIQKTLATQKFEQDKLAFYARYNPAVQLMNKEKTEYDEIQWAIGTFVKIHRDWYMSRNKYQANNILSKYGVGINVNEKRGENINQAGMNRIIRVRDTNLTEYNKAKETVDSLIKQKQLNGYAVGAVNIPYDQIAQIHQGEMIIPKDFSQGLRSGELSLSANTPNINVPNLNFMDGIKEAMQDILKTFSDYPKKTHDLLDDVINGRLALKVVEI